MNSEGRPNIARPPVPRHLVRDSSAAEEDAGKLDRLCRLAVPSAREVLRSSLLRRTADTGAGAILDEAKDLLAILLKDRDARDDFRDRDLVTELTEQLRTDLPEPDADLIEEQAQTLGPVLMSSWVDLLQSALETYPLLILGTDLLPARVLDNSVKDWFETGNSFGLNEEESTRIMSLIRKELITKKALDLPLQMHFRAVESRFGTLVLITSQSLPKQLRIDIDLGRLRGLVDLSWLKELPAPVYPGHALGIQGIVCEGHYVYPREIEHVIREHPAVAEVAIIDFSRGEGRMGAVVSLASNLTTTEGELLGYCQAHLVTYQRPTSIRFTKALPRDWSGRIDIDGLMRDFSK